MISNELFWYKNKFFLKVLLEGDGGDGGDGGDSPGPGTSMGFDEGMEAFLGAIFGGEGTESGTTDSEGNTTVSPGGSQTNQSPAAQMQAAQEALQNVQNEAAAKEAQAAQARAEAEAAKARAEQAARNARNPHVQGIKDALGESFGARAESESNRGLTETFQETFPGVTAEDVAEAGIAGSLAREGAKRGGASTAKAGLGAMQSYLQGKQNARDAANAAAAAEKAAQEAEAAAKAARDKASKAEDLFSQVEQAFNDLNNGGSYSEGGTTVTGEDLADTGNFGQTGFTGWSEPSEDGSYRIDYTTDFWDSETDEYVKAMYIFVCKQIIDRGEL